MPSDDLPQDLCLRERSVSEGWRVELIDPSAGHDEPLSWCTVVDLKQRIGSAVVSVGGIGGVGTRAEHRRKGHSRRVMIGALQLMQKKRFGLSVLHGIQDFYHRFGYTTCMAEHRFALQTATLLTHLPPAQRDARSLRTRRLRKQDLPTIARLHNRENAERTGSIVRKSKFSGFQKGTWWTIRTDAQIVEDRSGRVIGYVVVDRADEHCRVSEIGGEGQQTWDALLRFVAHRAKRGGHAEISVYAPGDHPFAVYCRRFGLVQQSVYPRNERPMGRIIDLERCITSMLPELEHRWETCDQDQTLHLQTEIGRVTLHWRAGRLVLIDSSGKADVRLGQADLALLLFGYARPEDLITTGQARMTRRVQPLMKRLFPLQDAHMWWTDRF